MSQACVEGGVDKAGVGVADEGGREEEFVRARCRLAHVHDLVAMAAAEQHLRQPRQLTTEQHLRQPRQLMVGVPSPTDVIGTSPKTSVSKRQSVEGTQIFFIEQSPPYR